MSRQALSSQRRSHRVQEHQGVVSFYADLNMDICSDKASKDGLLVIDHKARRIVVNLDHNPRPPTDTDGNPLKAPRRARR